MINAANVLISILLAGAVIMFIWFLRGLMLTPVPVEKSQKIIAVIKVSGSSDELERTVDGLLWLIHNGTLPVEILIVDNGMDESTRQIAQTLSRKSGKISLCDGGDLSEGIINSY